MTAAIAGVDGFMVSAQSFVRADQVAAHREAAVSHVDQLLARRSAEPVMTTYDALLIAAVAILLLLRPHVDPAIRLEEWRQRGRRRAQAGDIGLRPIDGIE